MDIRYFYKNNQHSYKHESIITYFSNAIAQVIELPPTLEVCLYDLGPEVYGGIDMYMINRIGLNYDLSFEDLPKILTHELIHVHQKHTKLLEFRINRHYYWRGIPYTNKTPEQLTHEEYQNLPWEIDVKERQSKVLQMALDLLSKDVL